MQICNCQDGVTLHLEVHYLKACHQVIADD